MDKIVMSLKQQQQQNWFYLVQELDKLITPIQFPQHSRLKRKGKEILK